MGTTEILISLVGGFLAGVVNTMAGFGSIISLAIYMDVLGIPGHIANATNRVNILASTSISSITFYKNGKLNLSKSKGIIVAVLCGALVGAYIATQLDADGFKKAFKYLLIPIFFLLLSNPKRFINPNYNTPPSSAVLTTILYFIIGIYAGFIQVGFGVIFLMVIIMLSKYNLITGNGLKVFIVAIYTIFILGLFHFNGMILWKAGIAIAIGQALGGYIAARNMSKLEGANRLAYYLLVLIVFVVILKNFEVWSWF